MDLTVIAGGHVVTPGGVVDADVVLAGEKIMGIVSSGMSSGTILDAHGCYVLPGGVDPHVHMLSDVPAADQALLGGTTTALSFTWPDPDESPVAAFERARDVLLPQSRLDVGLHAALWTPEAVTPQDIRALAELGVCGLKLYVAYPELGIMASDTCVYNVMREAAASGLPVQVHCENGDLIAALTGEALAAGRTDVRAFFDTRPVVAEEESVYRILRLAETAGCSVYLVHLSTRGALDHVRDARRRGVSVWAEACTWGLVLDDSVIDGPDPRPFMAAPPPRPRAHVEAVWDAVLDETLNSLGSDHHERPYTPPAAPDFTGIPYSIRGIRLRLPLLLAEGLQRGVPIERMADLLARRPARAFGLHSKGVIAPGADADVAIWDPEGSWTVGDDYPTFKGIKIRGAVRTVLRRGEVMVENGELLADGSAGAHLRREGSGS